MERLVNISNQVKQPSETIRLHIVGCFHRTECCRERYDLSDGVGRERIFGLSAIR